MKNDAFWAEMKTIFISACLLEVVKILLVEALLRSQDLLTVLNSLSWCFFIKISPLNVNAFSRQLRHDPFLLKTFRAFD